MFWRMTGLSTASPVDSILEKEDFTLEELLDEDEIIQECKVLNSSLINFLRDKTQVEQLLRYIIEEASEDVENKRAFKFPFIACEIFTCEVDIILRTLVEDEELMNLLFSFLKPDHPHSTLLAGYFSKVVICLMSRKTVALMDYVQGHLEIFRQLVDLIGITSIMEVLVRLICADENIHSNYTDALQWLEDTNVLEMIVDKFSLSDSPEVHANAAEILCALTLFAPPEVTTKIFCPSFMGRLFRHALEDTRPKSVLVHSLSICISLLDPNRSVSASYQTFRSQVSHGSLVTANPETVEGMLESLGDLLKLLDVSYEVILPTTYGSLQPPLGKQRLKIVEFISVLLAVGSEAAETELIRLGAINRILYLFFEYPYNNFLHHHVENIIGSCLESKRTLLIEHLLRDCDIVGKILVAEKQSTLSSDSTKPTLSTQGRLPPRIGIVGHMTRIANKLIELGNNDSIVQTHLQENSEWVDWHTNILVKRNSLENVYQWLCGRPNSIQDRTRDSDDEDFRERDYDVTELASNLSQAFQYGIYNNDFEEAHGSRERDDEDAYFDDESAEVVVSPLHLGDGQESSLFTNSNWFAFEDGGDARSTRCLASSSPNSDSTKEAVVDENDDLINPLASSRAAEPGIDSVGPKSVVSGGDPVEVPVEECQKKTEWVDWREESESGDLPDVQNASLDLPNGVLKPEKAEQLYGAASHMGECLPSSGEADMEGYDEDAGGFARPLDAVAETPTGSGNGEPCADPSVSPDSINSCSSVEPSVSEIALEGAEGKNESAGRTGMERERETDRSVC